MSELLLQTRKEMVAEAQLPSHQLLLRAGLVQRLASGIYSLTPLAHRVLRGIEAIVRAEMERVGGQEILLPVVQPAELWRESGRDFKIGVELARFRDRSEHPMVLGMTHEEAATNLVRSVVKSYRQLPLLIFQMQTKFRDEARPRGGLVRLREFLMKDAYSFHQDRADLDAFYPHMLDAYGRIFNRLELPVLVVEADTGMMGGWESHEFMLQADGGEDTLLVCTRCGYAANAEIAALALDSARTHQKGDEAIGTADLTEIATPGATTIAALCEATGRIASETLKAVFYTVNEARARGGDLILALIRGDLEVNELKLRTLLGGEVQVLEADEAAAHGLVAGYAGPVGLETRGSTRIIADDSVTSARPLIAGANRSGFHLAGVTYGRDYVAEMTGDIAQAQAGHLCPRCRKETLTARRGIEVAHTFKLGTVYSSRMGATIVAEDGTGGHPIIMASYGIGLTRLLACLIEQHHDEDGIIWPTSVAPYSCHLLVAGNQKKAVRIEAEGLYRKLGEMATLYDDRDVSTGVKLKDADLLGMPLRITVSERSLAAGGVELRLRRTGQTRLAPLAEVKRQAAAFLRE
jgi:prolyl-tRNA synthetase